MKLKINERFKLRAQLNFQCNGVDIFGLIFDRDQYDATHAARGLVLEAVEEGSGKSPIEPFAFLDREAAQELVSDLWDCGIRPPQASGSIGQLDAVNKHLQDMRTIAFGKIALEPPKER